MKSIGVTFQPMLQKTAKRNIEQHPAKLSNILGKKNKFVEKTEHFVLCKWRLKKTICQRIASVTRLTFAARRSALTQTHLTE